MENNLIYWMVETNLQSILSVYIYQLTTTVRIQLYKYIQFMYMYNCLILSVYICRFGDLLLLLRRKEKDKVRVKK